MSLKWVGKLPMLHSHLFDLGRLSLYIIDCYYSLNETILSLFKTEQMCYFIFLLLASQLIYYMTKSLFVSTIDHLFSCF